MEILISIFIFILGLIFGSFFNVVGLRSPKKETFINDRSYCPFCKHTLAWYELIPVFSFMIQAGKCRHCKKKIPVTYAVVELLTGFLFVCSYLATGLSMELLVALFFVSMLMIVLVSDITYMLIENKVLLFFLPIFIILRLIEPLEPWWSSIAGAAVGFGIVFIIILISGGGMGAGDMKLFGVLGIVLGVSQVIVAFFLACLIGTVIGILFISLKIIKRKQPVPFGPYIICASIIAYFYGQRIVQWYMAFLS